VLKAALATGTIAAAQTAVPFMAIWGLDGNDFGLIVTDARLNYRLARQQRPARDQHRRRRMSMARRAIFRSASR